MARNLIKSGEKLSEDRLNRLAKLFIPYSQLTEKQKDQDRKWVDIILSLICQVLEEEKQTKITPQYDGKYYWEGYNQALTHLINLFKGEYGTYAKKDQSRQN